jgi:hypothetical protein
MSDSGPHFYAWCDEAERVDALAATLTAVVSPGSPMSVFMSSEKQCETRSVDEALAVVRAHFSGRTNAYLMSVAVLPASERIIECDIGCYTEESELIRPNGPLNLHPGDKKEFIPVIGYFASGRGPRSLEAEAAVTWFMIQDDLEDLLLRLCAPDASKRIPTGACTNGWHWIAPVDMCATYNADAKDIARDLALSWVHLHDKLKVERASGMSLEALHARVEAAPSGARVEVKGAGQFSLARETVLKALAAPPDTLIEALEAAALPDQEWRAVEPRAREIVEASRLDPDGDGPPVWDVDLTTRKHVRFLEQHAPFQVRRLPSGGVVLSTHTFRSLWPLWADALFVLGLMS